MLEAVESECVTVSREATTAAAAATTTRCTRRGDARAVQVDAVGRDIVLEERDLGQKLRRRKRRRAVEPLDLELVHWPSTRRSG